MCMAELYAYVYALHEAKKGIRSFGTGIRCGYQSLCGCWELNLGLFQEQQLLLSPEPSLQPPQLSFITISLLKKF